MDPILEYISNPRKRKIPAHWNAGALRRPLMAGRWSNRLQQALDDRGWSVRELSKRSMIPYDNVAKYLQGKVDKPRGETVAKLAQALDVDRLWLQEGVGRAKEYGVPVVGYVGAGGQITFLDDYAKGDGMDRVPPPPGAPASAVALIVRGDSMLPMLRDGWVLIYWDRLEDPASLVGELVIVETEDGMKYVKTLRRGIRKFAWTLESENMPPIENVRLKWAATVEAIYPRLSWL